MKELATGNDWTPSQLAIAWVLAKGEDLVPIPGTRRPKYLEENAAAVDILLSTAQVAEIDNIFPSDAVSGERYNPNLMGLIDN